MARLVPPDLLDRRAQPARLVLPDPPVLLDRRAQPARLALPDLLAQRARRA